MRTTQASWMAVVWAMWALGGVAQAQSTGTVRLDLGQGTKARYKVGERLVGVDVSNDAVGGTEAVTGAIVFKSDGSIDASQSKIVVDMKTLSSDQTLRDMFLQMSVLQTSKFPTLEFVPTKAVGLPYPLPMGTKMPNAPIVMPQAVAFKLTGNMTYHGVTKEVTWSVVATVNAETAAGRATTTITFAQFNLTKPVVPILASAEDNINLEIEFRAKRTNN